HRTDPRPRHRRRARRRPLRPLRRLRPRPARRQLRPLLRPHRPPLPLLRPLLRPHRPPLPPLGPLLRPHRPPLRPRPPPTPPPAAGAPAPPTPQAPTPPTPASPPASATGGPPAAANTSAPEAEVLRLRGASARTATNMAASLTVPTATSVRSIPAKLLIDNRIVINNHLTRGRGGKDSFTHPIGYAVVHALSSVPEMNNAYTEVDGKPAVVRPEHVNLGLAIDIVGRDGSRQLLVPSIKGAEALDFRQFWM